MKNIRLLFLLALLIYSANTYCQGEFLYSRDGRTILRRRELIQNCLRSLQRPKTDPAALAICDCQVNLLNRHFTYEQFQRHTTRGVIDLNSLIAEDTMLSLRIEDCLKVTNQAALLAAQNNEFAFITSCMRNIQKNTEKKLDSAKLQSFCTCQLEMIKSKRISDTQLESIKNPNSLLFYELIYKCGDPYAEKDEEPRNWNRQSGSNIRGPEVDTVSILNLNGMTYVKLTTGSSVQVWLLDTGASDFLINTEMEKTLRDEKIISDSNYMGIGEYEMANGVIENCRRYKINDVRIGHFAVDNIIVAVSEKGKKIIAGKSLLNKFTKWTINNEQEKLILWK